MMLVDIPTSRMQWLSTFGGPLVVMPKSLLSEWRGATGDGADYELACTAVDCAELVQWHKRFLLVLGDESFQTAVVQEAARTILLRWMYAPDEQAIMRCLDMAEWGRPIETLHWKIEEAAQVIVDSALDGRSVRSPVELSLPLGLHHVTTHLSKPSSDVGAVLHIIEQGN